LNRRLAAALAGLVATASASVAAAFDADETFKRGSLVISPEAGYGQQVDLEHRPGFTGLEFANVGLRIGWLPFDPAGPRALRGSFEVGLEPLYQRYFDPVDAFFAGLGAAFRYHFLALGRFVPYAEIGAFAGGTDLRVHEVRSDFTFLLFGGAGVALFVTDRTAVYGGYRFQHVSNGHTQEPNRGFESHTGVVGVSFFFQ
jgi:opacity protein-like surface antigen